MSDENSYNQLIKAGYVSIGMDHYSKPNDEFALALNRKKLHRNFQGYCTLETTGQVYGFGASSISQLDSAYSQNIKNASLIHYFSREVMTPLYVKCNYESCN